MSRIYRIFDILICSMARVFGGTIAISFFSSVWRTLWEHSLNSDNEIASRWIGVLFILLVAWKFGPDIVPTIAEDKPNAEV